MHRGQSRGQKHQDSRCCGCLGNPIHIQLSAGNVHDVKVAKEMLEVVKLRPGMTVLANKAYGKWELREYIADQGADFLHSAQM